MYYTSEEENYRKYGKVILEVYDETLRKIVYHYRKPRPSERKEIILNYIIDNSGTPIKINYLSSKLAVSDRTIQKIIKELSNEWLIKVESCFIGETANVLGKSVKDIINKIKVGKNITVVADKANKIASMSAKKKSLAIWEMIGMDNFSKNAYKSWGYDQILELLMTETNNQLFINMDLEILNGKNLRWIIVWLKEH